MLTFWRSHPFRTKLDKLQATCKRVSEELHCLSSQVFHALTTENSLNFIQKVLVDEIQAQAKQLGLFSLLKVAMLTHEILMRVEQSSFKNCQVWATFGFLSSVLSEILAATALRKDESSVYIDDALTVPYVCYQQRKLQSLQIKMSQIEEKLQQSSFMNESTPNMQEVTDRSINICTKHMRIADILTSHYESSYKSINLLKHGLVLSRKLNSVLRFYLHDYEFLADFNRMIATDFRELYSCIQNQFQAIMECQKEINMESMEYVELVKEIEAINEDMFVIFLNNYCYSECAGIPITWILPNSQFEQTKPKPVIPNIQPDKQKQDLKKKSQEKAEQKGHGDRDSSVNTMRSTKWERGRKQQVLEDLKQTFKRKFNNDAEVEKKIKKVSKNRSFFEMPRTSTL